MEEGSVVKIAFIQSDKTIKFRTALLLKKFHPPFNDWLACAISGQLWTEVKSFDILLDEKHPDYLYSGLKYPGIIRLGYVTTISGNFIEGSIGRISKATIKKLQVNLAEYLIRK